MTKRTNEDGNSVVDVVGANSAVIYGPDGVRVGHYRKSHLFYMDKTWAKPGQFEPFAPFIYRSDARSL